MRQRIPLLTKILLAGRIALVFLPQYGYIQADEFFQSTEVSAGDILETKSHRVWEFTTGNPIRSAVFVHLFGALPFTFLKYLTEPSTYLLLVLPRLMACLLSFTVDLVAYRLRGTSALGITASSYIALTYFTRTFSNVTEAVLFSLLVLISIDKTKPKPSRSSTKAENQGAQAKEKERNEEAKPKEESKVAEEKKEGEASGDHLPEGNNTAVKSSASAPPTEGAHSPIPKTYPEYEEGSTFAFACILATGFFNRPTFLCFSLVPIIYRFRNRSFKSFISGCFVLFICSIPASLFFIVIDSMYYHDPVDFLADPCGHLVVTPLNFILYNSNPSNLSNHGIHPRWLHLVVNLPLLFGIHAFLFWSDLFRLSKRTLPARTEDKFLLLSILSPIISLSIFPHQEPRFLLGLLLPFACLYSPRISSTRGNLFLWFSFNIFLFLFYGLLHQASVVPMTIKSNLIEGNIVFYQTYMPPRHLSSNHRGEITDLKEASVEVLEAKLREQHQGYLVYPSALEDLVSGSLRRLECTVDDGISMWPHFSTEFLNDVVSSCNWDLTCLFVDSMMLHRVKFYCEQLL